MPNQLISPSQIREGFKFNFPNLQTMRHYGEWYQGNFRSMFKAPTWENGQKLYDANDLVKFNPLKAISQFVSTAVIADPPSYTATNPASSAIDWLDTYFPFIHRRLEQGAKDWSIWRMCVWVTERAPDEQLGHFNRVLPGNYFPFGDIELPSSMRGHNISIPYRRPTERELLDPQILDSLSTQPNYCDCYNYIPAEEINEKLTFRAHGTWTDWVLGELVSAEPANIQGVYTIGNGESWYGDVGDIVSAAMTLLTVWLGEIYNYANSPRLLPSSILANLQDPSSFGKSMAEVMAQFRNTRRPDIPVNSDMDANVSYLVREIGVEAMQVMMALLEYLWQVAAGASQESQGFNLGANTSGVAREKAQDPMAAMARSWRRALQLDLAQIVYDLGCPRVPVDFAWHVGPFENRTERNAEIRADAAQGIISNEAAGRLLGYAEQDIAPAQPEQMGGNGDG